MSIIIIVSCRWIGFFGANLDLSVVISRLLRLLSLLQGNWSNTSWRVLWEIICWFFWLLFYVVILFVFDHCWRLHYLRSAVIKLHHWPAKALSSFWNLKLLFWTFARQIQHWSGKLRHRWGSLLKMEAFWVSLWAESSISFGNWPVSKKASILHFSQRLWWLTSFLFRKVEPTVWSNGSKSNLLRPRSKA